MPKKLTQAEWIAKAKAAHGEKYDYSRVAYAGYEGKVWIGCPTHGWFQQMAGDHGRGVGCPSCGIETIKAKSRDSKEEFISKAKLVHGEKYDYSLVNYVNSTTKVDIICPDHGTFKQRPAQHVSGIGCRACGLLTKAKKRTVTFEQFVAKAKNAHGDRFSYVDTSYTAITKPVVIICPEHGEFQQIAATHLIGQGGCQACANKKKSDNNKLSQDEFITKARQVHGTTYRYETAKYEHSSKQVLITCQVHGDFLQTPVDHIHSAAGCPKCANERSSAARTTDLADYITKAVAIHGTRYDYSKVSYTTTVDKVTIICPEHGEFNISAYSHISKRKYGCPTCGIERRGKLNTIRSGFMLNNEELKAAIYARHGDAIKVLSTSCSGSEDLLEMNCSVHGQFKRLSKELLKDVKGVKKGCPKCGGENGAALRRFDAEKFAAAFASRNTNDYQIKDVLQFVSLDDKITLVCSKHGDFDVIPRAVIHGGKNSKNCPACAIEARTHNTEIFTEKAIAKHGYRYSYDKVSYTKSHSYVTVTCPEHGDFEIKAYAHLNDGGCPRCVTSGTSQMESDLCDYVSALGVSTVARSKKVIPPQELDIYVPSKNLGIEFCGIYWHSEEVLGRSYHKDKLASATAAGVRLITIFEDEWIEKRKIVEELLKRTIRGSDLIKLGARSLAIEQVDAKTAGSFYLEHHLQGPTSAEAHFALMTAGQVACLASFSRASSRAFIGGKRPASDLEVVRFCSHPQISVMGGLNRLVSAAIAHFSGINRVTSYVDLRWFTGSNYLRSGFSLEHVTDPGYFYVKAQQRFSRFSFAKHTLHMKLEKFDPALSEWENMKANRYRRIYDCGHLKLVKPV